MFNRYSIPHELFYRPVIDRFVVLIWLQLFLQLSRELPFCTFFRKIHSVWKSASVYTGLLFDSCVYHQNHRDLFICYAGASFSSPSSAWFWWPLIKWLSWTSLWTNRNLSTSSSFFGAVFNSTIVSSNANLVSTPATTAVGLFQRLDHMEQQLLPT